MSTSLCSNELLEPCSISPFGRSHGRREGTRPAMPAWAGVGDCLSRRLESPTVSGRSLSWSVGIIYAIRVRPQYCTVSPAIGLPNARGAASIADAPFSLHREPLRNAACCGSGAPFCWATVKHRFRYGDIGSSNYDNNYMGHLCVINRRTHGNISRPNHIYIYPA